MAFPHHETDYAAFFSSPGWGWEALPTTPQTSEPGPGPADPGGSSPGLAALLDLACGPEGTSPADFAAIATPATLDTIDSVAADDSFADLFELLGEGSTVDDVQGRLGLASTQLNIVLEALKKKGLPARPLLQELQKALQGLIEEVRSAHDFYRTGGPGQAGPSRHAGPVLQILEEFQVRQETLFTGDWTGLWLKLPMREHARHWRAALAALRDRLATHGVHECLLRPDAESASLPKARPLEILGIVDRLRATPSGEAVRDRLTQALSERGLRMGNYEILPCLAIEWPEKFPQFPGLRGFADAMAEAHRHDPALFQTTDSLRQAVLQFLGTGLENRPLGAFLARHMSFVAPYITARCGGAGPSGAARQVWKNDRSRKRANFGELIQGHADLLLAFVAAWARRGLPAHHSEIQDLLSRRGLQLSRIQVSRIPDVLPALECCGTWYVNQGQMPRKPRDFLLGGSGAVLFRGPPPDGSADEPLAGVCAGLLTQHPGGFTRDELKALLQRMAPQTRIGIRSRQVRALLDGEWILDLPDRRHTLNPDLLCADAARRVIAACPPRATWPPRSSRRSRCPPCEGARPEPDAPRTQHGKPRGPDHRKRTATAQAGHAENVFAVLGRLSASNDLESCIRRDPAGVRRFDLGALTDQVQMEHPGIRRFVIKSILQSVTPDTLAATRRREQWKKPRMRSAELGSALDAMQEELPLFHCLSTSSIADLINQRAPEFYCDKEILCTYFAGRKGRPEKAEQAIADMVADGSIFLHYKNKAGTSVNKIAVRHRLALQGIGCSFSTLVRLLGEHDLKTLRESEIYVSDEMGNSPEKRRHTAALVCRRLGHAPGDPAPSWAAFIAAFEAQYCQGRGDLPPLRYCGSIVTRMYLELQAAIEAGQALSTHPPMRSRSSKRRRGARTGAPADDAPPAHPAKRQRVLRPHAPLPGGNMDWNDFRVPLAMVLQQGSAGGGLSCLFDAMNNVMQDAGYCAMPPSLRNRGAEIQEALFLPESLPDGSHRQRTTPDGKPWQLLKLEQAVFAALAPLLQGRLDAAVIFKGNAFQTAETADQSFGHFVAVRRCGPDLLYIDGLQVLPCAVHPETAQALLGTADGQFWAALPMVACHGAVGQLMSYQGVAGFMDACDALASLQPGDPPPVEAFAAWLDRDLGLQAGTPHDICDALRRNAWTGIGLDHLAAFLQEQAGASWELALGLPAITREDGGEAFAAAVEQRMRVSAPGEVFLLKMPVHPGIVALTRLGTEVSAWIHGQPLPWRALMLELQANWAGASDVADPAARARQGELLMPMPAE